MKRAQIPVYVGDSVAQMWDNGGTNQDGPGSALTLLPGASPTVKESTDA